LIHSTAIVSPSAKIGSNVIIGPYAIVGDNVELGDNVEVMAHVCIDGHTIVGENTKLFPFAAIGYRPQDLKFHEEKSLLIIGKNNSIREYVTMHPGTSGGIMKTVIGDGNLFMVGVHIAHDCVIGNNVVMGNNATLGGHVQIEDNVIIGGLSAVHQWTRIGCGAIIGGMSGVERDVIPYGNVKGERAHLCGLNMVGLKRADIGRDEIAALKKVYEIIFSSDDLLANNIKSAEDTFGGVKCVDEVVNFMKQKSERSFCRPSDKSQCDKGQS
jgi:UDP-N-acetylglucosamine acyltransferase